MPNRLSPSSMAASLFVRDGLQHDREQPGGAGEVALPERVSGIGGKRWVDHPRDLGPFRQPARHLKRRLLMPRRAARRGCASPASRDRRPRARRRDRDPHASWRPLADGFLVHGDGAEHDVGMAADIFRRRLDRHVGAMGERLEIERRRPSVVENDHRAGCMRGLGDGRNVLHLESLRAGRFGEHDLRLLGDELVRCRRRSAGRNR